MTFTTRRKLDTGDSGQDYLVPLDKAIPMIYAFKKGSSAWAYHDERGVWSLTLKASGGAKAGGLDEREMLRNYDLEEHGWWNWSAWYVCGLLLLVTKRYVKKYWLLMHYLHAILGYTVMVVTIIFALKVTSWQPFEDWHNAFGSLCFIVVIPGAFSGSATAGIMRFYNGDKQWSKKERVTAIAKIHRIAGYIMLLIGVFTVSSGIGFYHGDKLKDEENKLALANFISFILLVISFEAIYRIRNKWSLGHVKTS